MAVAVSALAPRGSEGGGMRVAALMYHDVVLPGQADASGFPGGSAAHYKLDVGEFDAHLAALAGSGLHFVAVTDTRADDARDCLLTFDDGGASAIAIATALTQRGMVGHFLVTTAQIGQPGFVSAADIRALHAGGHVVGSHSHTHPAEISQLDGAAIDAEWTRSIALLTALLGTPVTVASVPGGFYSPQVAQAAALAGIRYLFTSEPTVCTQRVGDCLVLGRYTLWRGMSPHGAIALASGLGTARERQWLAWNLKKPLKRWARPLYRWVRRRWRNAGSSRNDT
jgi:peptidoglycan/xylan/chitin deacetylase (PgdA/CDA1 family)